MRGTVGIIGGGIGGVTAAIALHRAGWDVRVFERAAAPEDVGTALGMWPAALRALDEIGLGADVRRVGAPQLAGSFLRPDGTRIATIDVAAMARKTGDPVCLISRPALLRLLAGALPPDTVSYGVEVTDLAELRPSYDVVVVADGAFSRSRATLFGAASTPRYAGYTAWRGTVDGATDTVSETWGPGRRFGVTPREDGRTNWFATLMTEPDGHRPGAEADTLRALFGNWHTGVRRVLDGVREEEILRHDLYYLAHPLPTFVDGNVALIGDAAHVMTPDLGRGACEALIDAVTLGRRLSEAPDVTRGLAAYDRQRRRPTQRLVRVARTMGRVAQARRFTAARDVAVRVAMTFGT